MAVARPDLDALIAKEMAEASPLAVPLHVLAVAALGDIEKFRQEGEFDLGLRGDRRAPAVMADAEFRLRVMPGQDAITRALVALEGAVGPAAVRIEPHRARVLLDFALDAMPAVGKARRDALGSIVVSEMRVAEPILVDALRSLVLTMRTAPVAADIIDAVSAAAQRAENAYWAVRKLDELRDDAGWVLDAYGAQQEWETLRTLGDLCVSLLPPEPD